VSAAAGLAVIGVFAWGALVMLAGDHFVCQRSSATQRGCRSYSVRRHLRRARDIRAARLFVGPLIMAALLTVWREWSSEA